MLFPSSGPLADPDSWTPWLPLEGPPALDEPVLAELLGGGQAFRWEPAAGRPGTWRGVWGRLLAELRVAPPDREPADDPAPPLEWRAPLDLASAVEAALPHYLPDGHALAHAVDHLPWRSDPVLALALQRYPGLGLLRQPPAEALLAFLCSSTKRIPQIRSLCHALARRHGPELGPGWGVHALPDWAALTAAGEPALRACGLGYRARFVHGTACLLAEAGPRWLDEALTLPLDEARSALLSLPGVGPKIADCVLLFTGAHPDAFPIDTWIARTLASRYGLAGWPLPHLARFATLHFGRHAGLAQQYLFATARHP